MELKDFAVIVFIDIQCDYDYNGYLFVKELCAHHFRNKVYIHSSYQPPTYSKALTYNTKYAKSNRWLVYNHHRISVGDGARPYSYIFLDLDRIMNYCIDGSTLIYVIGAEKLRLLKNLLCGYENSKEVPNLILPRDLLIIDIVNNKAYENNSKSDYRHLTLPTTPTERKMYLMKKYIAGQNACIFHTSYNCARLNCQYLVDKFFDTVYDDHDTPRRSPSPKNKPFCPVPDFDDDTEEEDELD